MELKLDSERNENMMDCEKVKRPWVGDLTGVKIFQ